MKKGIPHTNSNERWRNVPGTTYIWHGEWSDPEIWYEGREINANELEDYMYEIYCEESKQNGVNDTTKGYEEWIEELGTPWLESTLDEFIWAMDGCN